MIQLLLIVVPTVLIWMYWKKPAPSIIKVAASSDYAEQLSEWLELLNAEDRVWAWGKRVSWLPPEEFSCGACMLTGLVDLTGMGPELKSAIDQEYSPTYIDGNCVVARMLLVATGDERLILGSIDDVAMRNKIASLCAARRADKGVCVQISSDSIIPAIEKDDREKFEKIWNQYASGSLVAQS